MQITILMLLSLLVIMIIMIVGGLSTILGALNVVQLLVSKRSVALPTEAELITHLNRGFVY